MKTELIVFIITGLLIANTYYDGKIVKLFNTIKHSKYLKMVTFAFAGLSIYLFLKKNPNNSKEFLGQANEMIKTLPMTRDSASLITPFLSLTNSKSFNDTNTNIWGGGGGGGGGIDGAGATDGNNTFQSQISRMMQSGKGTTKRSVSETKKKYIAASQNWLCKDCNKQLPAWFEVDHVIALHNGGTNEINNLVALCRDCHGKKTAMDRLNH
jgi:hypothetical protein